MEDLFQALDNLTHSEGYDEIAALLKSKQNNTDTKNERSHYNILQGYLSKIFEQIDKLSEILRNDVNQLVSVKHQKILRTGFQIITSLGVLPCLIKGIGIDLSKRCANAAAVPVITLSEEEKHNLLTQCTDFFVRSYNVPLLKNIILTFHFCDYLACLIQLSFAPLKKPGTYANFTMTPEMHEKLCMAQTKYVSIYYVLVTNCFQPALMKELLVLNSKRDPPPPKFMKGVITTELSNRLLAPGGVLSLIRCFIDTYDTDSGHDWEKINVLTKIISTKHRPGSLEDTLNNISTQLYQILSLTSTQYLKIAMHCLFALMPYAHLPCIAELRDKTFGAFDCDLLPKSKLPGTILISPLEVEVKLNVLHSAVETRADHCAPQIVKNLFLLFNIGMNCTRHDRLKHRVSTIIINCLNHIEDSQIAMYLKLFLCGPANPRNFVIEEYDSGIAVKSRNDNEESTGDLAECASENEEYETDKAKNYLVTFFTGDARIVRKLFIQLFYLVGSIKKERCVKKERDLLDSEDGAPMLDKIDQQYATILGVLSEVSTLPNVLSSLKNKNDAIYDFIESILEDFASEGDEVVTISLVLLNHILTDGPVVSRHDGRLVTLLKRVSSDKSNFNSVLSDEALSLLQAGRKEYKDTPFSQAMAHITLVDPESACHIVIAENAYGLRMLEKLINAKDKEAICKRHLIMAVLKFQLEFDDSYVYLAAINVYAALGIHCSDHVVEKLCQEYSSSKDRTAETRMKVGDALMKVIRGIGEMAFNYKSKLIGTVLNVCRESEPLVRASALSNLAELVRVLNYKMGTYTSEVLQYIWHAIEVDGVIECRRAGVMAITSLLQGMGKDTIIQLKDHLLPIYRTLKQLYRNENEDSVVRLHAQLALEELNCIVNDFLFAEVKPEKNIFVLDQPSTSIQIKPDNVIE